MKIHVNPAKISFFEDGTDLRGVRVVEVIIDGIALTWSSNDHETSYLDEVSEYFSNAIKNAGI